MLLPDEMAQDVADRVSGIKALDYVMDISRFHRIQASPGLIESLEYVKNVIESISDAKTELHLYDANGEGKIGEWEQLYGWAPKKGRLELIEPEKKILADFEAEPISLAAHSSTTNMEGEVVFVGKGLTPEDYQGKDVKGKIVLTTSRATLVHKVACILRGAAGVLTYIPPAGKDEIANIRRYEAVWPDQGELEQTTFGFALTQADGLKIKRWLKDGKRVKVKVDIESELGTGKQGVLSALIEGNDTSKEVWLMAHICHPHPGANDNASGSAAILEALRVISSLIRDGKIERPDYSIRFIWMPEWHGTIEYIHHEKEALSRCKFVINADMVGADPSKSGSFMVLYRTPYSLPSTLNNVVSHWICNESDTNHDPSKGGGMAPMAWKYSKYAAGSDHFMFTDSSIGIPAIMLNQDPDKFYHTSTDTPDKIDVGQMARAARIIALSALTLAHPRYVCKERLLTICRNEFIELMNRISINAVTVLGRCTEDPEKVYPRTMKWLGYAKDLGIATLEKAGDEWYLIAEQKQIMTSLKTSLEMYFTTELALTRNAYLGACAEVGLEAKEEGHFDLDAFESTVEIKRNLKYALPPGMTRKLDPERFARYVKLMTEDPMISSRIDEVLNLCPEWTKLGEIHDKICFQFGKMDLSMLEDIVKDLRDIGVIEYREAE